MERSRMYPCSSFRPEETIKNPPDPTDEVKMFIQEYKAYISKLFEKKVGKSA